MKFRWRPSPVLLLLLPIILPTGTARSIKAPSSDYSLLKREAAAANVNAPVEAAAALGKANPVGTKDAPVDGKDGLPHQGPFIETGAERDRKKTKESDDKERLTSSSKDSDMEHAVEPGTPQSNDGVMDDPNRLGPKEGTRGTEGGVSEKSKDSNKYGDKVPDPPKKEPPLPHSEAEEMGSEEGPKLLAEEEKTLLEVRIYISQASRLPLTTFFGFFRNLQICQKSLMIFLLRKTLSRTKTPQSSPMMAARASEIPSPLFQRPAKNQAQSSSPCTLSSSPLP